MGAGLRPMVRAAKYIYKERTAEQDVRFLIPVLAHLTREEVRGRVLELILKLPRRPGPAPTPAPGWPAPPRTFFCPEAQLTHGKLYLKAPSLAKPWEITLTLTLPFSLLCIFSSQRCFRSWGVSCSTRVSFQPLGVSRVWCAVLHYVALRTTPYVHPAHSGQLSHCLPPAGVSG